MNVNIFQNILYKDKFKLRNVTINQKLHKKLKKNLEIPYKYM